MNYAISRLYYNELMKEIRKTNPKANHKTIVDYLNKTAGILGGVKNVVFAD